MVATLPPQFARWRNFQNRKKLAGGYERRFGVSPSKSPYTELVSLRGDGSARTLIFCPTKEIEVVELLGIWELRDGRAVVHTYKVDGMTRNELESEDPKYDGELRKHVDILFADRQFAHKDGPPGLECSQSDLEQWLFSGVQHGPLFIPTMGRK